MSSLPGHGYVPTSVEIEIYGPNANSLYIRTEETDNEILRNV